MLSMTLCSRTDTDDRCQIEVGEGCQGKWKVKKYINPLMLIYKEVGCTTEHDKCTNIFNKLNLS